MSALIKPALLRGSKLILRLLELDLQLNEKYSSAISSIPTRMLDLRFFHISLPLLFMSALQELRGVLNKQLWVLVLRTMIAVGVQNELRVRQVLLEDERVNRIDEHVVAAVHHQRRLSDLLQVNIAIFRLIAPFLQSG